MDFTCELEDSFEIPKFLPAKTKSLATPPTRQYSRGAGE